MKNHSVHASIIATAVLLAVGTVIYFDHSHASTDYHCVAGPNEICASDQWVADFRRFKYLRDKYKMPTQVEDELVGMKQRLGAEVPKGYGVDEKKERFVKLETQPPPATEPAPQKGKSK